MRFSTVALFLGLAGGAAACHSDGKASDAKIANGTLTLGGRSVALPPADGAAEPVTQDDSGKRLAYPTKDGTARIVYVVGDGLFVGPTVARPVTFNAVPDLDHALGPLFEAAGSRRAELVADVKKARGDAGVVSLLVAAAYVDDSAWDVARKEVTGDALKNLGGMLANGLEPGKTPLQTRRAAQTADLMHPALKKLNADRAEDPILQAKEPKTAAVLLRATLANDEDVASPIGCRILLGASKSPELREAAALACAEPVVLAAALEKNACVPFVRCQDGKPVDWATSTKQDEPLCTSAELAPLLAAELAKPPQSAFDEANPRPELFLYAKLLRANGVPEAFTLAHARRRYALTEIEKPNCSQATAGAECHCDEATLRQTACIEARGSTLTIGQCRFQVDDATKTISKVTRASE